MSCSLVQVHTVSTTKAQTTSKVLKNLEKLFACLPKDAFLLFFSTDLEGELLQLVQQLNALLLHTIYIYGQRQTIEMLSFAEDVARTWFGPVRPCMMSEAHACAVM